MGIASDIIRRHNLAENSLIFWLLQFSPSSTMFPEPLLQVYFVNVFTGTEANSSVFCLVLIFYGSLLQNEISLMRSEDCPYLWIQGQMLLEGIQLD